MFPDLTGQQNLKPPPERKSQQYNQWAVKVRNLAKSEPLSREDEETNMSVRKLMIICDYLMVGAHVMLGSKKRLFIINSYITVLLGTVV